MKHVAQLRKHFVRLILKDERAQYLVVHHIGDRYSLWNFPGGKVEPGEGVEQAGIRELREEIGITATAVREVLQKQVELDGMCWVGHFLFVEKAHGEPVVAEPRKVGALCLVSATKMHFLPSIPALLADVAKCSRVAQLAPSEFQTLGNSHERRSADGILSAPSARSRAIRRLNFAT